MEKRTNLDKLNNLLKKAKEDLKIWLYYANVKSIKEFKLKEKESENLSKELESEIPAFSAAKNSHSGSFYRSGISFP